MGISLAYNLRTEDGKVYVCGHLSVILSCKIDFAPFSFGSPSHPPTQAAAQDRDAPSRDEDDPQLFSLRH